MADDRKQKEDVPILTHPHFEDIAIGDFAFLVVMDGGAVSYIAEEMAVEVAGLRIGKPA